MKGVLFFDNTTQFKWIKEGKEKLGIHFEKMGNSSKLYFMNKKDFSLIEDFFENKLHKFNFYEDYKPIKMIGKGSFASVNIIFYINQYY